MAKYKLTMKPLLIIFLLLSAKLSFAQTGAVPKGLQTAFSGVWERNEKYGINTVSISFEPGKDYAIFKDIGNGMAPPRIFHAVLKGKIFVIPPQKEKNDYIELEVIKGRLHLRNRPAAWEEKEKRIKAANGKFEEKVFKRAKPYSS
ncbi:MAG: hypothetical protein LBE92_14415 [Chryseobacterium sp.]|uniref:hypothetical protein n=1 Tax=Chryseobacterium sp. TaxID=1871047 RepID=UPI002838D5A5|nr:hypothetical protein [Chryseobacterium sp.]MDR2237313.1 hypothetical protein [Chryseobacterium sp.]